jgi:hypothetical protein
MNRSVAQTAQILGVDGQQIKTWAHLFSEYLEPDANPAKGKTRMFSDSDLLVLSYVFEHWDNPDLESIRIGLNREDHHDERYIEHLYMHTPLLQEPPDNLDETWRHGVLWVGGHGQERFELARNYRHVADKMLEHALQRDEARHWLCPVLFAYRHTLELYLKTIGNISKRNMNSPHSLAECVALVEKLHGEKFPPRAKGWIEELDKIDPHPATTFRYEGDQKKQDYAEYWVDLRQFKFAMGQVFEMIDQAILRVGKGTLAKEAK